MKRSLFFMEDQLQSYVLGSILTKLFSLNPENKVKLPLEILEIKDLLKDSEPKPYCCFSDEIAVFLVQSKGKTDHCKRAVSILKLLDGTNIEINSVGVFLDQDEQSVTSLIQHFSNSFNEFIDQPIQLKINIPSKFNYNFGFWSFPDCKQSGAVEKFILDLVPEESHKYSVLKKISMDHINNTVGLEKYKIGWNANRFDKAYVASMSAILHSKGGITFSFNSHDSDWLSNTENLTLKQLISFLRNLLIIE